MNKGKMSLKEAAVINIVLFIIHQSVRFFVVYWLLSLIFSITMSWSVVLFCLLLPIASALVNSVFALAYVKEGETRGK